MEKSESSEELIKEETSDIEPPESIAEKTPEEVLDDSNPIDLSKDETAEFDLSKYCFIRNKRLLNAELVVPQEKIAQIVIKH